MSYNRAIQNDGNIQDFAIKRILTHIILTATIFLAHVSFTVQAEDIANRRIIGFSPDGHYFAFEEFGYLNASGHPYANVYIINTIENKWVKGSPFRTVLKKSGNSLKQARIKVIHIASPLLSRLVIQRRRVRGLVSNPITELNADPYKATVNPSLSIRAANKPLTFRLKELPLREKRCRKVTTLPIKGIEVSVQKSGENPQILHTDERIPKSRGCPVRYAISDIVQLQGDQGKTAVYAIIYSVIRMGRNGLERRFIAGGFHDKEAEVEPDDYSEDGEYNDFDRPYEYEPKGKTRPPPTDEFKINPKDLRDAWEAPLNAPRR